MSGGRVVVDKTIEWLASRDGIAHAQVRGLSRALCGRPRLDPRWAWPATSSCPDCAVRAGVLLMAPR